MYITLCKLNRKYDHYIWKLEIAHEVVLKKLRGRRIILTAIFICSRHDLHVICGRILCVQICVGNPNGRILVFIIKLLYQGYVYNFPTPPLSFNRKK